MSDILKKYTYIFINDEEYPTCIITADHKNLTLSVEEKRGSTHIRKTINYADNTITNENIALALKVALARISWIAK